MKRSAAMSNDTGRKPVVAVHLEPASLPASIENTIRRRAYEFYEERGKEDGRDLEDWLRAEAEIVPAPTHIAATS